MNNCNTCFYGGIKDSPVAPCKGCSGYDKYVKDSIYFWADLEKSAKAPLTVQEDKVNKPSHYQLLPEYNLEVRDILKKLLQNMQTSKKIEFAPIDYADYFQAMAYFMRFMHKNGLEDLQKGVWYMNKLIENWQDEPVNV